MLDYLKYIRELKRLSRESEKLSKKFYETEKSYAGNDDQGHLSFLGHDCYELNCWIEYTKTAYLKAKADKLLVPMPDVEDPEMYDSYNFDDNHGDRKILTTKGFYTLREIIRKEHKSRREIIVFWVTLTTGLIGAAIGLVSVIKA